MQVRDIMSRHTDYLSPQATLKKASSEMLERDFGFLPLEENGSLVGVVTDRDIAIRGVAKGLEPEAKLAQIMTKNVFTAHEDDDIHAVAKIMEDKQIRRLVVLDEDEHIAGIVSLGDIATKCGEDELCGEIVHAVSQKWH